MHRVVVAVALLLCARAFCQDAGQPPPPADELRRVLDYMYSGKDRGPALVELKACLKVDSGKDSPTKSECTEEVKGPVKLNSTVHGWTMWLMPKGGNYDDVTLQFAHEGQVRSTVDIKLDTEGRVRTWRSHTVGKKGKWAITVLRGTSVLGTTSFTVE